MLEAGKGVLTISILMLALCALGYLVERWEVRDVARRCVRTWRRCPTCQATYAWDPERLVHYCACTNRGARIVRLTMHWWLVERVKGGRR